MRFVLATAGLLALALFGNDPSPPELQLCDAVQFAEPLVVGQSKNIVGTGCNGNDYVGPIMVFSGTGQNGIVVNGENAPYRATGGKIENLRICRKRGTSGGTAIHIYAIDAAQRPGEIALRRLKLFPEAALGGGGVGVGNWATGLHVDGSMLTTSGAAGIRRVTMDDVRIAGCDNRSMVLNNVVHCCMNNVQVDPGSAAAASIEIIDGQNIEATNIIVHGDLIIGGKATEVALHGRFHTVRIGSQCRAVTIFGTTHFLYVDQGATGAFHGHVSEGVANNSAAFKVF